VSNYYAVMLHDSLSIEDNKVKEHFNKYKDWLRFGSEAWLVYTDMSATEVRDSIRKEFESEDPSILVIPTDLSGWSAYSKEMPRNWLKKERDGDLSGV